MKRTVRFTLNSRKFGSQTTVEGVHVGDDNSCELIITVTDGNKILDLSSETTVATMCGTKPDGTTISRPCSIVNNNIVYTLEKQDTAVSGNVLYQVTVVSDDDISQSIIATAKFTVAVMKNIYIPIYRLLESEPSDWSANYTAYYRLLNNKYTAVSDSNCPAFLKDTFYYLVNPNYDSKDDYGAFQSALARVENLIGRASDMLTMLDSKINDVEAEHISNKVSAVDFQNLSATEYPNITALYNYHNSYVEPCYDDIENLEENKADKSTVDTALSGKLDNTAGSVASDNIASKAVTSYKIANGAVTTDKLADEVKESINGKSDKATTLAEYGINDAYTKTEVDTALANKPGFDDVYTVDEANELKSNLNKVIEPVKNLISLTTVDTKSDLTATIDGDDTISVSGETTGTSKTVYFFVNQITLPEGTYYLHKDFVSMGGISLRNTSNTQIANVSNTALIAEFTLAEEQTIRYIQYDSPTKKNISISGGHIWLVKDNDRTYEQVSAGFTWTFRDNYISKRAKTPVFAWVDDDGIMTADTTYGIKSAKAVADTLGIKCTFAVCSKYFEQFVGTVDFLLNAQDEGYQITNHSSDHTKAYWYPSEGEPDVANCRKELLACRKALVDNGFINIDDFVFPGGTSEDDSLIAMVSDYCRCGCMAGKTDGTTHIYGNGRYKIKRCFIRPTDYQGYTLEEYKTFIDNAIANGDMMIFGTHSGIQAQWDVDLVTSVLQYVIDSGYDIVTLNRAINQRLPVFNMSDMLEI